MCVCVYVYVCVCLLLYELCSVVLFLDCSSGIFDLRQRVLLHTFPAHDAPVKSIVVDETEEFFISGSEDGDIKVRRMTSACVIHFSGDFLVSC